MTWTWLNRRTVPMTALTLLAFCGLSGFTLRSDIDRADQKSLPTNNNAGLNSARVTPTDFVALPQLSAKLIHDVPGVHYAVLLRRHDTLFVGLDTGGSAASESIMERTYAWLVKHSAADVKIYISSDPTLINHFHRYAADRASHVPVGSDIVLGDVERNFPGVK